MFALFLNGRHRVCLKKILRVFLTLKLKPFLNVHIYFCSRKNDHPKLNKKLTAYALYVMNRQLVLEKIKIKRMNLS